MNSKTIIQIVAILLALGAFVLSEQLYVKHVRGSASGLIEAGCGAGGGGGSADCDEVLVSPYGYWPPKKADEPAETRHVPVALLGMIYYACMAVWLITVGRPGYERRWLHAVPLFINALGLAGSAWFIYLMFGGVLESWCPWCTITHVMNLLMFLCLIVLWPRPEPQPQPPAVAEAPDNATHHTPAPAPRATRLNPSARQVAGAALGMLLAWFSLNMLHLAQERSTKAANFDGCMAQLKDIQGDTRRLVMHYDLMEKQEIELRPDDPVRGGAEGQPGLPVIVFSDFECPFCDRTAFFLEEKVQPLFGGNLKITFKHYPLNTECNALAKGSPHPHACTAAGLAEGARIVGGMEAFWKAHDYLFNHRKNLAEIDAARLATELNLDAEKLLTHATSDVTRQRIAEDVALGGKVGVQSTPAVFVSGKAVGTLARMNLQFWDALADRYWQLRRTPRPDQTRLPNSQAAPATEGP